MATRNPRTETVVGLFVLVGLLLLGWLIIQFGRLGERLLAHYPVTVVFDDASGVIKGSDVRMGGAKIGRVADTPTLNADLRVAVPLTIRKDVLIPVGSKFSIGSASLLGDRLILVVPPSEPEDVFLQPGAQVQGSGRSGLEALQNSAEAVSRSAQQLMKHADATMEKVDGAIDDIRETTGALQAVLEKLDRRLLSETNLARLDRSLENIEDVSGSLNRAGKDLPDAVTGVRDAMAAVRQAADSAEGTFAKLSDEVEALRPAIRELPEAVANVSRVADKAGDVLTKVDEGEGVLGVLTDDADTGTNASEFIRNLRRYGILRYRDDATPADDPRDRFRGRRR